MRAVTYPTLRLSRNHETWPLFILDWQLDVGSISL